MAVSQTEWQQIVKDKEIRHCRICTSMIANHPSYGRSSAVESPASYKFSTGDHNICECCDYEVYRAWSQGKDWEQCLKDMTVTRI